jgi:NAD(P)-dependent dehydrogenase (short-subunit alcohol dehydrogenase family)
MHMSDFAGRVALITGASSGIGRATARAFAEKGAKVALAARREDLLASLADEIDGDGGQVTYLKTDVAIRRDVERVVEHTVSTFGRLDFGVNNAGTEGEFAPLTEMTEEQWDVVLNANLKGTFLCMKYEARAMLDAGHGGAIVNVGSVNSFLGYAGGTAYSSSKHGQVGLTTSASAELAAQGIRVNIVCPGLIDTPMHRRLRGIVGDEMVDDILQGKVHQQRAGRPEEIASSILFLCSEDASYVTGATLTPDGGFLTTI